MQTTLSDIVTQTNKGNQLSPTQLNPNLIYLFLNQNNTIKQTQ